MLLKTPVTFDVSVWELFVPLQVGGRLVIARPDGHQDPEYLAQTMIDHAVTAAHFVPSMLAVYVAEPLAARVESLRCVLASGEELPANTAARFHELSRAELHNLYGPTESTVDISHYRTNPGDAAIPIGVAVPGNDLLVLDEGLRPVPVGVAGELYLAGVQLARGYISRPDLTCDRFVANPYGTPGARMYRTGDLVRWRADDMLLYLGRIDFQVKLRGLRIELGEIESVLQARPDVAQAVVAVHRSEHLGDVLVAYLVATGGAELDTSELELTARQHLPDYMTPAAFVELDRFPINANGKLDRKALPAPDFATQEKEYRAPTTPTEVGAARIFEELLGLERVGADDDFFTLGGNSLLATRAVARVNAMFDSHLAVRDFFDASTVSAVATMVDRSQARSAGRVPLVPQPRPEVVPLSLAQQRMWFLNRFEPESTAYNLPIVVRLSGTLDHPALRMAVSDMLRAPRSAPDQVSGGRRGGLPGNLPGCRCASGSGASPGHDG